MHAEASETEMSGDACRHKDGSLCHCAAERRLLNEAVIDSDYLFAKRSEVKIRHAGEVYRLRLTKNGKLILNK